MLYSVTFPNIPILQTIFPCHELGNYIFPKIKKKKFVSSLMLVWALENGVGTLRDCKYLKF